MAAKINRWTPGEIRRKKNTQMNTMMCTAYLFWIHSAVNWHTGAASCQSCLVQCEQIQAENCQWLALAQEDNISILNPTCKSLIDSIVSTNEWNSCQEPQNQSLNRKSVSQRSGTGLQDFSTRSRSHRPLSSFCLSLGNSSCFWSKYYLSGLSNALHASLFY